MLNVKFGLGRLRKRLELYIPVNTFNSKDFRTAGFGIRDTDGSGFGTSRCGVLKRW